VRALAEAREKDAALARGDAAGALFGLPVAHKDLVPTRGIRTTYGSPIYRDNVPDQDALLVERLRAAGAITFGKTNTPEFGAGSQTFNEVFGRTLNPYDPTQAGGRPSGGAAVALACGMVPIADGGDTGGSLRNPASFCNVVGLRGAVGRVPPWPTDAPWGTLHVPGPMARTVADAALMLSVMAGPDRRSPIAIAEPGAGFRGELGRYFKDVRVAWSRDLGGLPIDRPPRDEGARRAARDVRGARLPRRGRRARLRRRAADLPGAARAELRGALRPAPGPASPPDEGHGHLEHRGGAQAHRARDRRGRGAARTAL